MSIDTTPLFAEFKQDLGITTEALNERLQNCLQAAAEAIIQEGVTDLNPSNILDRELIIDYAAWTWRKRRDNVGLPRMIRWRLNNRLFSLKTKADQ